MKNKVVRNMPNFLNDAPAGDFYLQVLGSLNGGFLYIHEVMATYRINAQDFWNELIYNTDIKVDFLEKIFRKSSI